MVTKVPRFTFEKFAAADARLHTQMKSVGEVMAIGRTFQESIQKALRGLETGNSGFDPKLESFGVDEMNLLKKELHTPGPERIWYVADAFRAGLSVDDVFALSKIDRWYLVQIEDLVKEEQALVGVDLKSIDAARLFGLKRKGFSDKRMSELLDVSEQQMREYLSLIHI